MPKISRAVREWWRSKPMTSPSEVGFPSEDARSPSRVARLSNGGGGPGLDQWLFPTRTLQRTLFGKDEALDRAREAANGKDVRIGGGAHTIQQYLRTGLVDEMHFAISPVVLGGGERPFDGLDLRALGYQCVDFGASERAAHVVWRRDSSEPPSSTGSAS